MRGVTTRESYHHGNLRAALLDAGLQLLDRQGEASISLRAVAREVGVSHAAPYHHFADKDDLFSAMAAQVSQELGEAVTERARDAKDVRQALHLLGVAYLTYAVSHPARFRLLTRYQRVMPSDGSSAQGIVSHFAGPGTGTWRALVAGIQEGQALGVFAAGDPVLMATTAWACVRGLATLLVDGMLTPHPATVADAELYAGYAMRLMGQGPQTGSVASE